MELERERNCSVEVKKDRNVSIFLKEFCFKVLTGSINSFSTHKKDYLVYFPSFILICSH